jgi:hypothetical protein
MGVGMDPNFATVGLRAPLEAKQLLTLRLGALTQPEIVAEERVDLSDWARANRAKG